MQLVHYMGSNLGFGFGPTWHGTVGHLIIRDATARRWLILLPMRTPAHCVPLIVEALSRVWFDR
jgi:hypothetical protein